MNHLTQISSFFLVLFFLYACSETPNTNQSTNPDSSLEVSADEGTVSQAETPAAFDKDAYLELDQDMYMEEYQGQKVWLRGKITQLPMQHMMKQSPPFGDPEKHQTVDFNDGEQTVIYYTDIDFPMDEQEHKYYGTIDKISGPGKGGGTHTEYFLMLDGVE
jgi:hypothetical protein